jgi:hypothetical protein
MVYNTQNYWIFGLCPSSGIVETTKHDVSETGCFRNVVFSNFPSGLPFFDPEDGSFFSESSYTSDLMDRYVIITPSTSILTLDP